MKKLLAFLCFFLLYACGSSTSDGAYLWMTGTASSGSITMSGSNGGATPLCSATSGTAPLAVEFDTIGTVSTGTNPADDSRAGFHQVYYSWNFGDAGAGNWTYGALAAGGGTGQSKNVEYGPVAAHVFDTAGTYSVTVTAYDGTNTLSNYAACTITVTAANTTYSGTNTTCVAQSTLPVAGTDGCPSGAAVATQSNPQTAVSTYCGSGKRVLFKHDDTFTGSGGAMAMPSGCYVDMYGTGAKPIINSAYFSQSSTGNYKVANMDLESPSHTPFEVTGNGNSNVDILFYNNKAQNCGSVGNIRPVSAEVPTTNGNTRIMMVGNYWSNCGYQAAGSEITGYQTVFMGNFEHGPTGSVAFQLLRFPYTSTGFIGHNHFESGTSPYGELEVRAPIYGPPGSDSDLPWCNNCITNHVLVSDNELVMDSCADAITNRPVNTSGTMILNDIIDERNYFHAPSGSVCGNAIEINAQYVTARNNVIDASNTAAGISVRSDLTGTPSSGSVVSHDVWVYNNTLYSSTGGVNITQSNNGTYHGYNLYGYNNLGYATSGTNVLSWGTCNGLGVCTGGTNTGDVGTMTTNPNFTNASGLLNKPLDFKPNTGSYAIGAGTSEPNWYDFFQVLFGSPVDLGAIKH